MSNTVLDHTGRKDSARGPFQTVHRFLSPLHGAEDGGENTSGPRIVTPRSPSSQFRIPHLLASVFLLVLVCLTVFVSTYGILRSTSLLEKNIINGGDSDRARYEIAAILLTLEAIAIVTFIVQDRRRRRLELLLHESEDRMAFSAEAADMGLWGWDAKSDRFWATEHCQDMLGIQPGIDYSMATISQSVHEDDRAMVTSAIQRGISSGATFEVEFRIGVGGGKMRWARCRARAVLDQNGRVSSLSGTIIDVSDRKKMQTEVERQRQSLTHLTRVGMLGELSGALAHELNQPLTAIMSNAQAVQRMLGQENPNRTDLRDAIDDIIADNTRASDVIRHLRALLKKDELRRERLDLNAVVRETLELCHSDLISRRVEVSFQPSAMPMPVTGDAIQIQQLLLNLVMNAADAMCGDARGGGVLIVSVDATEDGMCRIAVADTGPGIRQQIADRLFEPFFSTKAQGLGLGLSISRTIVNAHGGRIYAENNPGRGATFYVLLPAAQEDEKDVRDA